MAERSGGRVRGFLDAYSAGCAPCSAERVIAAIKLAAGEVPTKALELAD